MVLHESRCIFQLPFLCYQHLTSSLWHLVTDKTKERPWDGEGSRESSSDFTSHNSPLTDSSPDTLPTSGFRLPRGLRTCCSHCDIPSPAWLIPSSYRSFQQCRLSGKLPQGRVALVATLPKTLPPPHFKIPFLASLSSSYSAYQGGAYVLCLSPSSVFFLFCLYPALECQLSEGRRCVFCVHSSTPSAPTRARHLVGTWTSNPSSPTHPRSIFSPSVPCSVP